MKKEQIDLHDCTFAMLNLSIWTLEDPNPFSTNRWIHRKAWFAEGAMQSVGGCCPEIR